MLVDVLNDKFVAGHNWLSTSSAHLPQSHSDQCMRTCSTAAAAVLSVKFKKN